MPVISRLLMTVCCMVFAASAQAHNLFSSRFSDGINQQEASALLTLLCLLAVRLLYLHGSQKRRPSALHNAGFQAASGASLLVMLGPLDTLAESGTAAHMIQHMLVIGVIAPLWVASRPLAQIAAGSGRAVCWKSVLQLTRHPLLAAYLHGAVIWLWHTPYVYMVAVVNPWWHAVEHLAFLSSAVLFWWAVLQGSVNSAPWSLLALLFTLMHTGFLGALLTFAGAPLYGEARDLEDQQLAGLIMWVAGSAPYLLAAAAVGWRWHRQLLQRMPASG